MSVAATTKKANKARGFSGFDPATAGKRHAAALADPDVQPWTEDQIAKAKRRPRALTIRRALKLDAAAFAALVGVSAETVLAWEGGSAPKALHAARLEAVARDAALRYQGQRGPQKAPTKKQLTLRIDPDVLDHYRATGEGWQRRMNDALRAAAKLDQQQAPAATIAPQRRRAGR